jgi:hypothetical protein
MKKINKYQILLIIGFIIFLISIVYYHKTATTINNIGNTKAIIKEIDANNIATIEYTVNEKTYTKQIATPKNTSLNDEITIYYNKNNPELLADNKTTTIPIIILIISLIILIYTIVLFLLDLKKQKRITLLKSTGIYIEATIEEIIVNSKGKPKKGKYPYHIRCIYTNPSDKSVFRFESDNLYFNVNEYINEYNIKKLPIYVDKNDYKNYYIDIYYAKNKGLK